MIGAAILATLSLAGGAQARPVALPDAKTPPTYLRYLQPGERVTVERQCPHGGYWSDLSAYRWNGAGLPGQQWSHDRTRTSWGRVTFDGVTWSNHYRLPVIVAGWCE